MTHSIADVFCFEDSSTTAAKLNRYIYKVKGVGSFKIKFYYMQCAFNQANVTVN